MKAKPDTSSKFLAFIAGAIFGVILGFLAVWAFEIRTGVAAAAMIAFFALLIGFISAFACPKKTETIILFFLTLLNP